MTEDEIWKPVPGYEGLYEVSNLGSVKSLPRKVKRGGNHLTIRGGLMTPSRTKTDGRYKVELSRDGAIKTHTVHRLVARAFLGEPEGVRDKALHKNGDNLDNRVENLYWGTQSENMFDRSRHGNHPNGAKTNCPRGHPYDQENTRWYKNMRYCKACSKERGRNDVA